MEMNNFLTWELLGTFAGCLTVTGALTEWLKKLFPKVHPQVWSYGIALCIILAVRGLRGQFQWSGILLDILNAALVSIAANGGFDAIKNLAGGGNSSNSDGGSLVVDKEDGMGTAYIDFAKDPATFKDGEKVTFTIKNLSQE